jgi:hypothetical protein
LASEELPSFQGIAELYERYWGRKRRTVGQRLKRDANWLRGIDTITAYLSAHQVLSTPGRIVEEWKEDVNAMVSEHVLVLETRNIRFFHEGFCDYAFARRFVDSGGDVLQILLQSEQHLFRRAQVRQVLSYARGTDFQRYLLFLERILFQAQIRFHIKRLIVSGLSQCEQPYAQHGS